MPLNRHYQIFSLIKQLLFTFFVYVLLSSSLQAAGNCSPYMGQASLNEFFKDNSNQSNSSDDYAEVKILNPTITSAIFNNWTIKICEEDGSGNNNDDDNPSADCSEYVVPLSDFEVSTTPWKILKDGNVGKYINFKSGFEAILLDNNGDVIDYVSVAIDGTPRLEEAFCPGAALSFPYLAGAPGASDKFIFRTPDGTGLWGSASSGSAVGTQEETNDVPSGGGTYPELTVSDVTVTKGTSIEFDLTLDKLPVASSPITLNFTTLGGTAVPSTSSPSDYTYTNSSVTFTSSDASTTQKVIINTEGVSPASSGTVFLYLQLQSSTANIIITNAYPKGTILGTVSQTIVLSTGSSETLDGLSFTNGSLAEYDPITSPATLYFNESKFAGGDENINATHILPDGNIILSTDNSATLGLNSLNFDDGDLVKYNPTTDMATTYLAQNTAFNFIINIFKGNFNSADITAVYIPDDESYIILATLQPIFVGSWVGGEQLDQGDLVKYYPATNTAEIFLDKSNFSVNTGTIDAVHVLSSGNILLSTTEGGTIGGYSFRDGDIVEYNPNTNITNLYFDQNLFSRNGADINALTLPKSNISSIHHIEFIHDGSALTCNPEKITIKACADNNVPCAPYTSAVTVSLLPTGWGTLTTSPTVWTTDDSVTFTSATGSVDYYLQHTTTEPVTLNVNTVVPAASNAVVCRNTASGPAISCTNTLDFKDSGFIFDVTSQTSCVTSADITMSAVKADPSDPQQCIPFFNGKSATVKFWNAYSNPSSGTRLSTLDFSTNPNPAYDLDNDSSPGNDIPVTFDANGEFKFTLTYPDAGELDLSVTYTGSVATSDDGLSMSGNKKYVTVPAKLYVYSDDTNTTCASNDGTCSAFKTAGNDAASQFNLKVRAACADDSVTPNFAIDNIFVGHTNTAPAVAQGNIAVSNFNIATGDNGEHIISTQSVSEVGAYTFTATSPTYLGVTGPVGTSSFIGRFYPHHFDTSVTQSCGTFSYSGQNISVTATAQNNWLPTPAVTQNYTGTFAYNTTLSNSGDTSNFTQNIISTFNDGTGNKSDVLYTFSNKETPPLTITLQANDTDTGTTAGVTEGTTEIRSGRARLENTFGSELTPLTMPLKIEYFTDSGTPGTGAAADDDGFIANVDDTCTTYNATAGALTNYTGNLSNGETTVTGAVAESNGLSNIIFSAPGTGNEGSVNLLANNISSWLTYSWNVDCDNADGDNDITTGIDAVMCGPFGTASFGLYRGDDRVIYWREVF